MKNWFSSFFGFFKSPAFWQTAVHAAIVGAGAYGAYVTGTPLPLVISGGLNALVTSPQEAGAPKAPAPAVPVTPLSGVPLP